MTYRKFSFGRTIYTKTMAALKKEAAKRSRKLYEARHRLDPVKLVHILVVCSLLAHGTMYG
jgi:hypothetical protein